MGTANFYYPAIKNTLEMRHVKLKPGTTIDAVSLRRLIEVAYTDIKARVENG